MSKIKRIKSGCLKSILFMAAGMLAVVVLWAAINLRPTARSGRPLVVVSPETTVIEGPLNGNGDVDYLEALNQLYAEGVTPENNAMVKILEGIGPVAEGSMLSDSFFARLGIDPLPKNGLYYVDYYKYLENAGIERTFNDGTQFADHVAEYNAAMASAWDPEQNLMLETWFQGNQIPMEKIREGLKRPRYYHPLVNPDDEGLQLIGARLSVAQSMRELARFFGISAMRHMAKNEIELAFEDILAIYRLGKHSASSATLVEELIGIAITGIADSHVASICATGKASSKQLMDFQKALEEFKPHRSLATTLQKGERYMMLDTIISIGRGGSGALNSAVGLTGGRSNNKPGAVEAITNLGLKAVDWRECTLVVNAWHEHLIEMAKIENDQQRLAAFREMENDLKQMEIQITSPSNIAMTILGGRRGKGKAMGEIMNGMLTPALGQIADAEVRSKANFHLTRIAVALAAFEKDNGVFPKTLSQLVPKYIKSLPLDPYVGLPFNYSLVQAVDENGDLETSERLVPKLFSVGRNGVDESGPDSINGSGTFDDIEIRWE